MVTFSPKVNKKVENDKIFSTAINKKDENNIKHSRCSNFFRQIN